MNLTLTENHRTHLFTLVRRLVIPFIAIASLGAIGSMAFAQSNDECLGCHNDKSLTAERNGKEVSLFTNPSVLARSPHKKLNCISCHAGFDAGNIPHKENIQPIRCTSCHKNAVLKHQFHAVMLRARQAKGQLDNACKECHGKHDVVSPHSPGAKFNAGNITQACGECHKEVVDKFMGSAHGNAMKNGVKGAPNCIQCHSNEITARSIQDTVKLKNAQVRICLSCHLDNPDVRARMAMNKKFIADYEKSVHGAALLHGNGKAPGCVNCHGSHDMQKAFDPKARTNKLHIADVCGQCHTDIAAQYRTSSHGVALGKGVLEAPTCTDCHGEHNILHKSDPNSPVASQNVSSKVCTPCHSSMKLSQKYGFASDRAQSYSTSYHGLALRGGSAEVANCASCHGVHNIKNSSDSTSTVYKANLAKTCGKCHPGAGEAFTRGSVHLNYKESESSLLYWIATIYIILIASIIGGMFLHNLLDFYRKSKRKLLTRRGIIPEHRVPHRLYVRMTVNERFQHASLLISFFLLVFTGFMLRFPDAWWVAGIRSVSTGVFEMRSLIHRIAGIVMIAASVYHLWYIIFTRRGRRLVLDLLPKISDATDAVKVLKYNLGFSKVKPKFDRFSYIEKSEYWALVWGNIVMGATGFVMWFDNYFMNLYGKLGYDVARTVHYYEAWLAFLAIVVWHIYFVIFNPDSYPMNVAWLKGTITEEEMEDEHALELERIKAEEQARASDQTEAGAE
jgi:cytochrome b subunit of formate dehydrogenase